MKKPKKKVAVRAKPKTESLDAIKVVLNAQLHTNDLEQKIVDLNRQLLFEKNEHNTLKQRLTNLLNKDQIEAAGIAGCALEVYAIEWLDICKDRVRELTPAFTGYVHSLRAIKEGI